MENGVTGVAFEPIDSRFIGFTTSIESSSESSSSSSSGYSLLTPFDLEVFSTAFTSHKPFGATVTWKIDELVLCKISSKYLNRFRKEW